jgi:chromosome segregation protein
MRLQRVEISGFKSFSDRAELSFDRGVTAIVGPNGCGKSNVADAILWVLGEQSAKSLRGDRMEDVIFNGSDARKPTGAAEVRLMLGGVTLSRRGKGDGDAAPATVVVGDAESAGIQLELGDEILQDVELTRRLYRSGESEYLINGELCRLRDVHDLLMDTGLGAKAYAIIEQGKIGQILGSKPTERRQLIEEAAGVTKYKARRRAAELKLEASEQNLTRIDDIVFEVEKQRNALKRQAARARRYRRLRDELRHWEKALFARRYRELAATIRATRAELESRRSEERQADGRLALVEQELAGVRVRLAEAESEAATARDRAHACEIDIDRHEGQIALNRQQVEALEARAAELEREIGELKARRDPSHVALSEARNASERANIQRLAAEEALRGEVEAYSQRRTRLEGLEGDVEDARREVLAAVNAATTLRHAIDNATQARDRVLENLGRLEAEASDLAVETERVRAAGTSAETALERARADLEKTSRLRAASESDLAGARAGHESSARELRSREQELAASRARLESLEQLDAARAAYGEAARLVLQSGQVEHHGTVADYLEVDPRFERAIEAGLGELLEHVLVDTADEAERGIDFVREQSAGRCGFLIVGRQDAGRAADGPASFHFPDVPRPGSGLLAIDRVVGVNGAYRTAISAALGSAWICESRDQARAAASSGRTIVTVEGDVFRGTGVVQGGVKAEARGILATKREIKELRERLGRDEQAIASLAGEIARFESAIRETEAQVGRLVAEVHAQEKAIVGFEAQAARAAEEQQRNERKADLLGIEVRRAEEERSAIERRQAEARTSIVRIEGEQREADERLAAAQRRLLEAREVVEGLSRTMGETRASCAALTERASALATEVARLEQASRELEARLDTRSGELRQAGARRGELEQTIVEQERDLAGARADLERMKTSVRQADERITALRGDADAQEGRIREARGALEQARAVVSHFEVARAKAENDLTHLATSCLETLHASLDEVTREVEAAEEQPPAAVPRAGEEEGEEEAEEEGGSEFGAQPSVRADSATADAERPAVSSDFETMIGVLREKIERLGPVNMMAIEQFDELEERHKFLTAQRKDLVDSIAATGEAIRRIDVTTRQRFREAFELINSTFQQTFRTLFGGGNAGLSLIDDTDMLESGIEIIAQPPGKRLQSVQLLSGGEKALTAIALMFALFRYKPGPFCVLDEIDAPLDDANIGRFLEMLRDMQENTQFILITHNRKTMEMADRLYGVTMEEPGVSKLLSVRLDTFESDSRPV